MSDETSDAAAIRLRRYATGKVFAFTHGDPQHLDAATRALARSVVIEAKVDRERFLAMMRSEGVPDEVALVFLARVRLDDEAYLQDVYPS